MTSRLSLLLVLVLAVCGAIACARAGADGLPTGPGTPTPKAATRGGELQVPLPLFPPDNWWNLDIRTWPKDDAQTTKFLNFVGANQGMHPDFGGDAGSPPEIYGFPYMVVDGGQPKRAVQFDYSDESDGVDHNTDTSFPFYPIPDEAITQTKWIEGGYAGNQCPGGDKHMLIVDRTNNHLYELYDMCWDGAKWTGGSGAFFDMKTNNRRPEGWTSADAAGLAILPGLVRYDEVYGNPDEIDHAFRVTLHDSNGYVYPASHDAGDNAAALPMGTRLRLKSTTNISAFTPEMQKIFRAMMKYGLIMADNGSDMYVSGTHDTRWDNDILNPAFDAIKASDFEVIQLGYNPSPAAPALTAVTPTAGSTAGGSAVVLSGDSFRAGATVSFDGSAAGNVVVDRSTRITATTPAHAAGPVNVVVTNPGPSASNTVSFSYCAGAPGAPAITTPNQVVVGATGQTASVPAGATSYTWTLAGGRITAGQGTTQLTYAAGPPGTTMRLRVSQTSGCASAAATAPVQVDFLDTPPAHSFRTFVNTLARNGITSGCGNGNFCPGSGNTRAQMAVFLLRGVHGSTYTPPAATGVFDDVPINDPFAPWIEQLASEGITSGCIQSPPQYCPSGVVTRSAMAVFLLRGEHGSGYTPPAAQGVFQDVPADDDYAAWIEQLYNEGITSGCGTNPLRYCPDDPVTRGQMAVFLVRTFSLT